MINRIVLPLDFVSSDSFSRLEVACGDVDKAAGKYSLLFSRLGYLAREGGAPGFIAMSDGGMVEAKVGLELSKLVAFGILITKDSGWFCPAFASLNASVTGKEKTGGFVRAYLSKVNKGKENIAGQIIMIPKEALLDASGAPLAAEVIERMKMLVLCCDSAVGKMHRPPWEYSAVLVQNSLRVLGRYTDEQINSVCRQMAAKKDHPYLAGMTTEQLLAPVSGGDRAIFDEVLERIGA